MKRFFGTVPPWGILTGVRPAKIAAEMLDMGMGTSAVKKTLEKVLKSTCKDSKSGLYYKTSQIRTSDSESGVEKLNDAKLK